MPKKGRTAPLAPRTGPGKKAATPPVEPVERSASEPEADAQQTKKRQRRTAHCASCNCSLVVETMSPHEKSACLDCYAIYSICFQTLGNFSEFALKKKDDAMTQARFQTAALVRKHPEKRDFHQNCVTLKEEYGLHVRQSLVGLNGKQFLKRFGKTPEECGLKYVNVPDVRGHKYRGVLLLDPMEAYTRYEVVRSSYSQRDEVKLPLVDHLYKEQGNDTFDFQNSLLEDSKTNKSQANIKHFMNVQMTFAEVEELADGVPAGDGEYQRRRGQGSGSEAGDDEELQKAPVRPLLRSSPLPTEKQQPLKSSASPLAAPMISPASARYPRRQPSSRTLVAVAEIGDNIWAMSEDGDGVAVGDTLSLAKHKMKKLCLTQTLQGAALGRERRNLTEFKTKLEEKDAKMYRAEIDIMAEYLDLYQTCDKLSGSKILHLAQKDLSAALSELKAAKVDFPTTSKMLLVKRTIHTLSETFFSKCVPEEQTVVKLFAALLPFDQGKQDGMGEFDLEAPRLHDCEGSPTDLTNTFLQHFWKCCLCPLAERMETEQKDTPQFVDKLLIVLEDVCAREDLQEEHLQVVYDAAVCLKAFLYLIDPCKIDYAKDYSELLNKTASSSGELCAFDVYGAWKTSIKQSALLKILMKNVQVYTKSDDHVKEANNIVAELDDQATVACTLNALAKFIILKANVRPGAVDGLRSRLLSCVAVHLEGCKELCDSDCSCLTLRILDEKVAAAREYCKLLTEAICTLEPNPSWAAREKQCMNFGRRLNSKRAELNILETLEGVVESWKADNFDGFSAALRLVGDYKSSLPVDHKAPPQVQPLYTKLMEKSIVLLKEGCINEDFMLASDIVLGQLMEKPDGGIAAEYRALASIPSAKASLSSWQRLGADTDARYANDHSGSVRMALLQRSVALQDIKTMVVVEPLMKLQEQMGEEIENIKKITARVAETALSELVKAPAIVEATSPFDGRAQWYDEIPDDAPLADVKKMASGSILQLDGVKLKEACALVKKSLDSIAKDCDMLGLQIDDFEFYKNAKATYLAAMSIFHTAFFIICLEKNADKPVKLKTALLAAKKSAEADRCFASVFEAVRRQVDAGIAMRRLA